MTKQQELDAANRGEGCLGRSQSDEPVFVLVARDRFSSEVIRFWARLVQNELGKETPKVLEAKEEAIQMDTWRVTHGGGKIPD